MKKILLLLIVSVLTITMQAQTSLSSSSQKQEVKVCPNLLQSGSNTVTFTASSGYVPQSVVLVTSSGDPLGAWFSITGNTLYLPKLSKGLYILKFSDKDNIVESKKIVVQ